MAGLSALCFLSSALLLLILPAPTHQAAFLTDVTSCASQWIKQTPGDVEEMTKQLTNVWSSKPHKGLQYALMLEPYLVYLISIHNPSAIPYGYVSAFVNYCNTRTGVEVFTSCMKKSQSISEEELNRPDSVNILNNMYTRYCNESGNVHEHVLSALLTGSTTKAIRKLSAMLIATNNSVVCGDVVESSLQTAIQLINEEDFKMSAILDIMESAVEVFARCLIVSIAPNQKARKLKEHIDIVLLKLIGSNVADISRVEMSKSRQTLSLSGFGNVLLGNRRKDSCSVTGTHKLLHNNLITLTGTLLYERISGGSLLPYLAAVHIKFPIYDDHMIPVGHVTYSSGMKEKLQDDLITMWWENDEINAKAEYYDHGISIQVVGEFVEITDTRTGTYITLHKAQKMLTVVVRMYTTYIYQSSGLLIDQSSCHSDGQTPVYAGVLPTSSECRSVCHKTKTDDINSMCQKDCLMSEMVPLISTVYTKLEEMLIIASIKDDIIEKISAIENDVTTTALPVVLTLPDVTVPRDAPAVDQGRANPEISTEASDMMVHYKTTPGILGGPSTMKTSIFTTKNTAVKYGTVTKHGKPIKVTRRAPPPKPQGAQNSSPTTFLPVFCTINLVTVVLVVVIL